MKWLDSRLVSWLLLIVGLVVSVGSAQVVLGAGCVAYGSLTERSSRQWFVVEYLVVIVE